MTERRWEGILANGARITIRTQADDRDTAYTDACQYFTNVWRDRWKQNLGVWEIPLAKNMKR